MAIYRPVTIMGVVSDTEFMWASIAHEVLGVMFNSSRSTGQGAKEWHTNDSDQVSPHSSGQWIL